MTGLRPSTTGIYSLQPAFRTVPSLKDYISLPKAFAANGYATSTCGKMYHKDAGKDEFETVGLPGKVKRNRLKERFVPTEASKLDWGPWPPEDAQQRDYQTAEWAVDALTNKSDTDKPFFMAVGFYRPHVPLYASQSGLISIPRSHSSYHRFDEMIARTRPASPGISTGPYRSHA